MTPGRNRGRTRKEFLGEAAAVGVGVLGAGAVPAAARSTLRSGRAQQTVAVLGGGVAGLTAAHELAERGFAVSVYERRAFGGKARSVEVAHSGAGGRRPLPGEHGMRFFPGFYQNLPDTMRRIPFGSNPRGTFDNLVSAPQGSFARDGGREDVLVPWTITSEGWTPEQVGLALLGWLELATGLPPHELSYFVARLQVFFSSSDARRLGQWEQESWWDFVAAEHFSEDYRRLLANSVTRQILAAKAQMASARTLGLLWEAFTYNLLGRSGTGTFDRVLDAPTNEAWIDPWLAELHRLGVDLHHDANVERLHLRDGRIAEASVRTHRGQHSVRADWFVLAVPVERARHLWNADILRADPQLSRTAALVTQWMNGIQFYLRRPTPIVRGHVLYIDSPWALSSISQGQFWPRRDFARDYGDGTVADCLSVDIGDFTAPGILYGTPAAHLDRAAIARECWAQMKAHLNDTGREVLTDDLLASWFIDPGLIFSDHAHGSHPIASEDPLMISTPGAWRNRPTAVTAIPNLFLAADYVKVGVDTACMEGANEAARRAVNALLDRAGSAAEPAHVYELYQPPEYEPLRAIDASRFSAGQPNALDTPPP